MLFASWTSEANNTISVRGTNRDINFHGGVDHDNVVEVVSSSRTDVEAGYLSPVLFVNDTGTSYGAPTDPDANTVTFRYVNGTNKAEVLTADPLGSEFHARSGADTLIGGKGVDLFYADKGDDIIFASAGNDRIDGGWAMTGSTTMATSRALPSPNRSRAATSSTRLTAAMTGSAASKRWCSTTVVSPSQT